MNLFDAHAGVTLAVIKFVVLAGIIVKFMIGLDILAIDVRWSLKIRLRRLEVVIVQDVVARLHFLHHRPFFNTLEIYHSYTFLVKRHVGVARERGVAAIAISQDEGVSALGMLEIIINPFLFHQPADEVEIGLAILNAVFPLRITRCQGVFDVGDSTLL